MQMVLLKNNQPSSRRDRALRQDVLAQHHALIAYSLLNFFNDSVLGTLLVMPGSQQCVNNMLTDEMQ